LKNSGDAAAGGGASDGAGWGAQAASARPAIRTRQAFGAGRRIIVSFGGWRMADGG
jgi:hypothetical protein